MRKVTNSLVVLLAFAFIMFSCGDDEGPKKQFSVEGKSYELTHGYRVLIAAGEDADGNDIYTHAVYLTGKDLELSVDDGLKATGNDDILAFALVSSSEDEIKPGTYEFTTTVKAGVIAQLLAYTDYGLVGNTQSFDRVFGGTAAAGARGTIKVSKSGDKYTFRFNITTYLTEEGDETVEGEGSFKAYFSGKLELLEASSTPARKSEDRDKSFSDLLNF